jgi:uncharacterized membrane protein required for colicin V production
VGTTVESLQALTLVDYLLIGVLVAGLAIGWARGFVDILTGFVVFLISSVVAGRYSGEVVAFLNRTWGAQEWLAGMVKRRINLPPETYKIPASAIPWNKAFDWMTGMPMPEAYKQSLAQRTAEWSQSATGQTAAEFIAQQIAAAILSTVVFIILALVIGWVLSFLSRLVTDQVKEIPLFGTANRLLGSVVYVFQTAIIISLVVALVAPVLSMYGMQTIGKSVEHAYLTPYFLEVFAWVRSILFGATGDGFFVF